MEITKSNEPLKILLTGGSGFLGQNILREIHKDSQNVIIYNLGRTPVSGENVVNIICEDICTFVLDTINEQFDYIIHTLSLSNEAYCKDLGYAHEVNVEFTRRLMEFSITQKKLKKIIYISSIIIYSNNNASPVNVEGELYLHHTNYAFTKGIAEKYVIHYKEKYNLPVVVFRLSNIYGPYQNFKNSPFLVPSKIVQALQEGKIEVFSLLPKRDWIYSEDAAKAIALSIKNAATGVFNLASGEGISVEEIIVEISKQLDVPFSSLNKQTTGLTNFYCDISETMKAFSWKPTTSLHDGIKNTIEYAKATLD